MKREEFADLALSHRDEIASYARRLTDRQWDADDLVQATYERAFRSWSDLRDATRLRSWLFRICRRLHLDRARATAARPELRMVTATDPIATQPTVSADTVERATAERLERALGGLPPDQREAVLLCDVWGFRYQEIGRIVEVPVGTVRSRVARAREALARLLQEAEDPQGQKPDRPALVRSRSSAEGGSSQ